MKITKFEHACFAVTKNDQSIIIDPGGWTTNLNVPEGVVAVIITHEHQDHLDANHLQAIAAKNPNMVVIAHEDITTLIEGLKTMPVVANEGMKIGHFELEFFGGQHATIIESLPSVANLGVLINQRLYYPGDSFTIPEDRTVELLALPVSAPWMKFSEAVDFVMKVKPKMIFPTHDAILSQVGKGLVDSMVPRMTESTGATYSRIDSTPLEI